MLNAPREIPYAFRVLEIDGIVWLFDSSEYTYCCSSTPTYFLEPVYWADGECDEILPDCGYWSAHWVDAQESIPVPLHPSDIAPDVDVFDAWDTAREEVHANHLL